MSAKKPTLLVPRQYVREVTSETDAANLLRTGSWCRVAGTKPISPGAAWQKQFRATRTAEGKKQLLTWVSGRAYEILKAKQHPGESLSDCLDRLVKLLDLIS